MDHLADIWDRYSVNIVLSVVVLLAFLATSYIIDLILRRIGRRAEANKSEVYRLISGSQKTVLIIIGVISALGTLGVNVSALVAGLGLTGFAFGLALKDAISNLLAGIMIVFYKPFELGDEVELAGAKGKVIDINLRYITLEGDDSHTLIPNSLFLNNKVGIAHTKATE